MSPAPKAPAPPKHLSKSAQSRWRAIVKSYEFETAQLMVLQATLDAWDRMNEARVKIKFEGMTFKDRFGQVKANPLCSIERDARSQVIQGYRALGLDYVPDED